nr:ribosomal protein L23 [Elakatothrix viridis]
MQFNLHVRIGNKKLVLILIFKVYEKNIEQEGLFLYQKNSSNNTIKEKKTNSSLKKSIIESTPTSFLFDLIKFPRITEKSTRNLLIKNQYTFDVDLRLTKTQIKQLFEALFNITIVSINTHRPFKKKQRIGLQGFKSRYKRVILTLKKDELINF